MIPIIPLGWNNEKQKRNSSKKPSHVVEGIPRRLFMFADIRQQAYVYIL